MKSGRTAGKKFIPKQYIDYYKSPYAKSRLIAKTLATVGAATIDELVELTGAGRTTIKNLTGDMRHYRFIYISGWRRTAQTGLAPIYSVGNQPDVPRKAPGDRRARNKNKPYAEIKKHVIKIKTHEQRRLEDLQDLASRLAPQRSEEERQRVNRQYLSWLFKQSSAAEHNHGARHV